VSFEEWIMSKDKYPSIFLSQLKAVVLLFFESFSQCDQFSKLGNGPKNDAL